MFFLEATFIFAAWLLFVATVGTDYSRPAPRFGLRFGVRGLLVAVTVAAFLLGATAVLTNLSD